MKSIRGRMSSALAFKRTTSGRGSPGITRGDTGSLRSASPAPTIPIERTDSPSQGTIASTENLDSQTAVATGSDGTQTQPAALAPSPPSGPAQNQPATIVQSPTTISSSPDAIPSTATVTSPPQSVSQASASIPTAGTQTSEAAPQQAPASVQAEASAPVAIPPQAVTESKPTETVAAEPSQATTQKQEQPPAPLGQAAPSGTAPVQAPVEPVQVPPEVPRPAPASSVTSYFDLPKTDSPAKAPVPPPEPATIAAAVVPPQAVSSPAPVQEVPTAALPSPAIPIPVVQRPVSLPRTSTFDPDQPANTQYRYNAPSAPAPAQTEPVGNGDPVAPVQAVGRTVPIEVAKDVQQATALPIAPAPAPQPQVIPTDRSANAPPSAVGPAVVPVPILQPVAAPSNQIPAGYTFPQPQTTGQQQQQKAVVRQKASTVSVATTDPFNNPKYEVHDQVISPTDTVRLSRHEASQPSLLDQPPPAEEAYHQITPTPVSMPLPALHEIIPRGVVRIDSDSGIHMPSPKKGGGPLHGRTPSGISQHSRSPVQERRDDDEFHPLLSRTILPRMDTRTVDNIVNSSWPAPQLNPTVLGWSEYILPDSSYYYYHPLNRVVTDVDLRNQHKLDEMTAYIDREMQDNIPQGWEMWVRDTAPNGRHFAPWKMWVSHERQIVGHEEPDKYRDDHDDYDRLKLTEAYWSFVQAHPAHAHLPPKAHEEAYEILTWNYTDGLITSESPAQPVFTAEECQELMTLLRNLGNGHRPSPGHSRTVAKIQLRATQWRQSLLSFPRRAEKPAENAAENGSVLKHTFRHFFFTFFCLGIPYLYAKDQDIGRHRDLGHELHTGHFDHQESGPIFTGLPIVAALVLSSSVTFLALPGLDPPARIASMAAGLLAVISLVATLITGRHIRKSGKSAQPDRESLLVSHNVNTYGAAATNSQQSFNKRNLHRSQSRLRSRFSQALPAVLLGWSLIALCAAIVLYAVRGALFSNGQSLVPTPTIQEFNPPLRWLVVGTWVVLIVAVAGSFKLTRKR